MAQLQLNFQQIPPNDGVQGPIPAGWYNVKATDSELKPTKEKNGAYLQVRFQVLDGEYQGSGVFARFNIQNSSQQAQSIGLGQLSAFGHAVGVMAIQDSQQLHGIPLKIKVKLNPATSEYGESNDVVSYKNINFQVPGAAPTNSGFPQPQGFPASAQQPFPAPTAPQFQQTQPPAAQPWNNAPAQPWEQQSAPVQQPQQQPQLTPEQIAFQQWQQQQAAAQQSVQVPPTVAQPPFIPQGQPGPDWANQQVQQSQPVQQAPSQPVQQQATAAPGQLPPWMQQAQNG